MPKERLRFRIVDDITLLRQVREQNPYEDPSRWKLVQANVIAATLKNYSLRTVKEHAEHLLKLWSKGDHGNLKKSGSEEQYKIKENLLQQINDISKGFRILQKHKTNKTAPSDFKTQDVIELNEPEIMGPIIIYKNEIQDTYESSETQEPEEQINSDSASMILRNEPDDVQVKKTKILRNKYQTQLQIKKRMLRIQERKLTLEERKLNLEEEKFYMEKKERETRITLEMEERRHRIKFAENQQKIIEVLLKQINEK